MFWFWFWLIIAILLILNPIVLFGLSATLYFFIAPFIIHAWWGGESHSTAVIMGVVWLGVAGMIVAGMFMKD